MTLGVDVAGEAEGVGVAIGAGLGAEDGDANGLAVA
jgi:hypothetical protein